MLEPLDQWQDFVRTQEIPKSVRPEPNPEHFPFHDHPNIKPLFTTLLQRRSKILRRWTPGEHWAVTRCGFIHHIHPDAVTYPRPFRTVDLDRDGMCIVGPIRHGGGCSTFEISWHWGVVWKFRGQSGEVDKFVKLCRAIIIGRQSNGSAAGL